MPRIKAILMGGAGLLAALAVACGGGDSDEAGSNGDTNGGNGGEAVAGNDAPAGGSAQQTVNLNESAARLSELTSFRFDMSMAFDFGESADSEDPDAALAAAMMAAFGNISAEGAFVAPDSMAITASFIGQEFSFVQIGDEAWERVGDTWEPTTAEASLFSMEDPASMVTDFLPDEVLEVAETSRETINGVDAIRYSFDKETLEAAATELGEDTSDFAELTNANLDIWLTEDGIPVRILMDISGQDETGSAMSMNLEMNISDINSDSVTIERPE